MGLEGFLNNVCASYKIISSGPKKLTEPIFSKKSYRPGEKIFGLFSVTIRPLQTSSNKLKVSIIYMSTYGACYKIVLRNTQEVLRNKKFGKEATLPVKKKTGRLLLIPSSMTKLRKQLAKSPEGVFTIIVQVIRSFLQDL